MPQKKVNYFQSQLSAPEEYTTGLFCIPYRYIPIIIAALETRKSRSFWASQDDFVRGYEVLNEVQLMLLQDCSSAIVNNIIAMRGLDPAAPRDPVTGVPQFGQGYSDLSAIFDQLNIITGDQNFYGNQHSLLLGRIEAAIQQGLLTEQEGELVARLAQILLVL